MAGSKRRLTEPMPQHRILREIYRHYTELKAWVTASGNSVIEHSYPVYEEDEVTIKEKITVTISFWDLHGGLETLSNRKREAVYYNVILDKKQKDVAKQMGITTVSVGQYVEQAMLQLAENYFAEGQSSESESSDAGSENHNGRQLRR